MDIFLNFLIHTFLPFVIVLTILVFVHELGHYLAARRCGVQVDVFSIGFGPEVFGFTDKAGTRWKFSLIPLGGYVKMFGDADASSKPDYELLKKSDTYDFNKSLFSKSVGQRSLVSFAGPLANYIFAFIVLAGLVCFKGEPTYPPIVEKVVDGMAAKQAGLLPGDRISHINGVAIQNIFQMVDVIHQFEGKDQTVQIWRPSEITVSKGSIDAKEKLMTIIVKPKASTDKSKHYKWGIQPSTKPEFENRGLIESIAISATSIYRMSEMTLVGIGQMIIGKRSSDQLGGIFAIGDAISKSTQDGISAVLNLMVIISVSLGLINLLPIPMLDGGHLLFYGIEAIIRRPVSQKIQEAAFTIGFVIVIGVMALSMWNDAKKFKFIDKVSSLVQSTPKQ